MRVEEEDREPCAAHQRIERAVGGVHFAFGVGEDDHLATVRLGDRSRIFAVAAQDEQRSRAPLTERATAGGEMGRDDRRLIRRAEADDHRLRERVPGR